jgi:putative toxin-antitoxin system antitoxin component (TIGR02293 family)
MSLSYNFKIPEGTDYSALLERLAAVLNETRSQLEATLSKFDADQERLARKFVVVPRLSDSFKISPFTFSGVEIFNAKSFSSYAKKQVKLDCQSIVDQYDEPIQKLDTPTVPDWAIIALDPNNLNEYASTVVQALVTTDYGSSFYDAFQILGEKSIQKPYTDCDLLSSEFFKDIIETQINIIAAKKLIQALQIVLASLAKENTLNHTHTKSEKLVKNNKVPAPDDEDLQRVRERLSISIAEGLADLLDFTDKEMAKILTVSIRTYHRLKPNGLLNPVASERLSMLNDLTSYGVEVFEIQGEFNKWLRLPLRELSDNSPLNSLDTATGFTRVKTILGRIEYGIY